jgi:hypothetical protein
MATCAYHPETAAVAYCRTCGKPLCEKCKRDVHGVIYCEDCLAARLQGAMPPEGAVAGAVPPPPMPTVSAPSVGLATFLGFIPGMGALYNGQFGKAFAHILIFGLLIAAMERSEVFVPFFLAFLVYMVVDAYRTAKARIHGQPLPDLLGLNSLFGSGEAPGVRAAAGAAMQRASAGFDTAGMQQLPVGAIVLIGLGLLFLLDNLGILSFRWFGNYWPVLLIVGGIWIGYKRWNAGDFPEE